MSNLKIEDSARLVGRLRLGNDVYISQGSILRSNSDSITIGNSTWVLENSVIIGTPDNPLSVGSKTVFGHKCIAIGTEIGDLCEIGNNTIFLPGSKVGDMCIFGEGTIIPEGAIIEDSSVVVGRPGRIIRKLTKEDKSMILRMRNNNISLDKYIENIIQNEVRGDENMAKLYKYQNKYPQISKSAKLYDTAEITGDVIIGANAVIGAGVKIIGNSHGPIRIGNNVQILENSVLHLLPDNKLIIHDNVTIGPGCMIHGTTIGKNSIIESGAIICDYSSLGENTLVRPGSLIKQKSKFSDNDILEGFPAAKVGENTEIISRPNWAIR